MLDLALILLSTKVLGLVTKRFQMPQVVGALLAGHDGRRGYLYHAAVLPEFQRQGIARALVAHAMEALEREGIHKAALVVFQRNAAGNAFWEKIDFSSREDLVYRYKSIHVMTRIDT